VITGEEDVLTGVNEAELMRHYIAGSQMRVIPKAGHYSAWERPEDMTGLLSKFLEGI
jgi:pimeloyl-ACP methyl ester carboxylesterase